MHLPLATDLIEGTNWSKGAMEILEQTTEYRCYDLPAFPIAAASVNSFYGCIHFPMRTVCKVVKELLEKYEESHPDDFHAGWVETSCMQAFDKEYVREGVERLPKSRISEKDMIFKKRQRLAMREYGHLGDPAAADGRIGRLLNEDCAEYLARAARHFARRKDYLPFTHYALYDMVFMHAGFLPVLGRVRRKKVSE